MSGDEEQDKARLDKLGQRGCAFETRCEKMEQGGTKPAVIGAYCDKVGQKIGGRQRRVVRRVVAGQKCHETRARSVFAGVLKSSEV